MAGRMPALPRRNCIAVFELLRCGLWTLFLWRDVLSAGAACRNQGGRLRTTSPWVTSEAEYHIPSGLWPGMPVFVKFRTTAYEVFPVSPTLRLSAAHTDNSSGGNSIPACFVIFRSDA